VAKVTKDYARLRFIKEAISEQAQVCVFSVDLRAKVMFLYRSFECV